MITYAYDPSAEDAAHAIHSLMNLLCKLKVGYISVMFHYSWAGDTTLSVEYKLRNPVKR